MYPTIGEAKRSIGERRRSGTARVFRASGLDETLEAPEEEEDDADEEEEEEPGSNCGGGGGGARAAFCVWLPRLPLEFRGGLLLTGDEHKFP